MIATAHGQTGLIVGTGEGSWLASRLKYLLQEMEEKTSYEAILVKIDELKEGRQYPLRWLRAVRQFYVEKIRRVWVVRLDAFRTNIVHRFTKYTRKIPGGIDRIVNKRKTFLKSLIN